MTNAIITTTTNAINTKVYKNAELTKETNNIANLYTKAATTALKLNVELAKILDRVESKQLYKDDGFKSLAEYAEDIGLKKSNAHALARAGHIYNDKDAPAKLKELTPSNLAELSKAIAEETTREAVYTDAEKGKFDNATQKQLREYAAEKLNTTPKAKVEKNFYASFNNTFNPVIEVEGLTVGNGFTVISAWESYFKSNGAEYIKIPSVTIDEQEVKRAVVIEQSGEAKVIYMKQVKKETKVTTAKKVNAEAIARIATKVILGNSLNEAEEAIAKKYGLIK